MVDVARRNRRVEVSRAEVEVSRVAVSRVEVKVRSMRTCETGTLTRSAIIVLKETTLLN